MHSQQHQYPYKAKLEACLKGIQRHGTDLLRAHANALDLRAQVQLEFGFFPSYHPATGTTMTALNHSVPGWADLLVARPGCPSIYDVVEPTLTRRLREATVDKYVHAFLHALHIAHCGAKPERSLRPIAAFLLALPASYLVFPNGLADEYGTQVEEIWDFEAGTEEDFDLESARATANGYLTAVDAVMGRANLDSASLRACPGLRKALEFDSTPYFKVNRDPPKALNAESFASLIDWVLQAKPGGPRRWVLDLALLAGLRRNEIVHTRTGDLVSHTSPPGVAVSPRGNFSTKNNFGRMAAVPPAWLDARLATLGDRRGLVVADTPQRAFAHALDVVNELRERLPDTMRNPLHHLRKVYATGMAQTHRPEDISTWLGHGSMNVTASSYYLVGWEGAHTAQWSRLHPG
jgi:integrase